MRTAIDTNVISAIWTKEANADRMVSLLTQARAEGGLVVCGAVYAELLAHPKVTVELVDRFLAKTEAEVDFDADESIWKLAGNRFSHYARRRRESAGSHPRRLLVDFVVGAHCLLRANRLVTLDAADYALAFPELRLMS